MFDSQVTAALITAIPAFIVAAYVAKLSRNQVKLQTQQAYWENQNMQRELFESFNKRFDKMNEHLNAIRDGVELPDTRRTKAAVVQDYLNLCSEEYLWYSRGIIDEKIWNVWLNGINHYIMKSEIISQGFAKEKLEAVDSYYGLFSVLRTF